MRRTYHSGLQVLRVVTVKSTLVWDVKPCSPLEVRRLFGGTYCLQFRGGRLRNPSYHQEEDGKQNYMHLAGYFLALQP
jgi:hypothetical protein